MKSEFNKNVVVVAGAGAGKTYTLVQEFIFSILGLDGTEVLKDPRSILAVTFTDKAAMEMRERVSERLLGLIKAPEQDVGVCERLEKLQVSLPPVEILKKMHSLLPEAKITTFHSFCANTLKQFSLDANLSPEFTLIEPTDEREMLEGVAEQTILRALREKRPGISNLLTAFQFKRMGDAQGLVDMLVNIYGKMCEHGASAQQVKLANASLLKQYTLDGLVADLDAAFLVYDDVKLNLSETASAKVKHARAAYSALRNRLKERTGDFFEMTEKTLSRSSEVAFSESFSQFRKTLSGRFGPDALRKNIVESASALGAYLCNAFTMPALQLIGSLLHDFSIAVDVEKNRKNVLGFGDLLIRTVSLLGTNLSVRKALKKHFARIMVDEFQDTSPLQEDLVAYLCENLSQSIEVPSGSRAMGNVPLESGKLFIVGDPKQSIYGFRGADANLFTHTLRVVTNGAGKEVSATGERKTLDLCRRSQGAVVELVNLVAQESISSGQDGVPFEEEDRLSALRDNDGVAGEIWRAEIAEDEVAIDAISKRIADGVRSKLTAQVRASDFVVLVRRIKIAKSIAHALKRLDIDVKIFGGDGFFSRQEILDLLAVLQIVVDPSDEIATMTVLRSPFINLSDEDLLRKISNDADWKGGVSWVNLKVHFEAFEILRQHLKAKLYKASFLELIEIILANSNYEQKIYQTGDYEQSMANIEKLKYLFASNANNNVQHIQKLWALRESAPKVPLAAIRDKKGDAVQIMTIHQSKGLEFKNVIIADVYASEPSSKDIVSYDADVGLGMSHQGRPISVCASKDALKEIYPTAIDRIRSRQKERGQAELSRLLYVALTRARDRVFWTDAYENGKPLVSRGLCLNDLFLKAQKKNEKEFTRLMPLVMIDVIEATKTPLNKPILRKAEPQSSTKLAKPPLYLLPSSIDFDLGSKNIFNWKTLNYTNVDKSVFLEGIANQSKDLGILAHAIIGHVGQISSASELENENLVLARLKAYMRLRNIEQDATALLPHCLRTLQGMIGPLMASGFKLTFEMPIAYELAPGKQVEGSADLVAERSDTVFIIDFKSSVYTALAHKTANQLSAYAKAFETKSKKAIWLAPYVIGDARKFETV